MKFQGILRHLNTVTADMMIQPDAIDKFSSVVNDRGIDTQLTSYCITQLNSADPASYTRWFRSITKSLTPQTDPLAISQWDYHSNVFTGISYQPAKMM